VSSALVVALIVAGIAVVVAIAVLGYLHEKKRREAMVALAGARGWVWTDRDDRWCDVFSGAPFGQGHNRQARHVMTGVHEGRGFVGFDYVYYTTETSTDSKGHTTRREVAHPYAVLGLQVGANVPRLSVSPEGFFGRTVGKLFGNDIELESEDFNRAFTVSCPDRKFASDVLHPQMMEYLLQHPRLGWRFEQDSMLVIARGRRIPAQIEATIQVMDAITDLVPEFVWLRLKGQG
jgi:hypothetical protein